MADNLCGPSNALQNFQKHSTVDRTLQQDRLISRQSPSQGFRSSGPNAGFLDPEFEAFQAGQAPLQQLEPQPFQHHGFAHAPSNINQAGPSDWASDFQRLNVSSPPPQFQQHSFNPQSQQQHNGGGWHQDFARQQAQNQELLSGQFNHEQSQMNRFSPMSTISGAPRFAGPFMNIQSEQASTQQQTEAFDEEAFARAFEEASRSKVDTVQESEQHQGTELGQDIMINESAERLLETEGLEPVLDHRIGADLIHDPSKQGQNHQERDDPDALARTAGTLLSSVAHETSEKFQNSQFLELMRQLRDREAVVEGDKIVANADADSKLKIDLADLSFLLKKFGLDRDRPLDKYNIEQHCNFLEHFLTLTTLYNKIALSPNHQSVVTTSRIQKTLSTMAMNPSIQDVEAVHYHIRTSLSIFNQLASSVLSPEEAKAIMERGRKQSDRIMRYREHHSRQ